MSEKDIETRRRVNLNNYSMKKEKSKNYNVCKEKDLLNFIRRKIFKRRDFLKGHLHEILDFCFFLIKSKPLVL
jgi:hypothetical protein